MGVELFFFMSLLMVLVKNEQEDQMKIGREQRGSLMENQDNLCPFCLLVFYVQNWGGFLNIISIFEVNNDCFIVIAVNTLINLVYEKKKTRGIGRKYKVIHAICTDREIHYKIQELKNKASQMKMSSMLQFLTSSVTDSICFPV